MFFTSDNAAGVHPDILAAVARAADGPAVAYGSDDLTLELSLIHLVFRCMRPAFPCAAA